MIRVFGLLLVCLLPLAASPLGDRLGIPIGSGRDLAVDQPYAWPDTASAGGLLTVGYVAARLDGADSARVRIIVSHDDNAAPGLPIDSTSVILVTSGTVAELASSFIEQAPIDSGSVYWLWLIATESYGATGALEVARAADIDRQLYFANTTAPDPPTSFPSPIAIGIEGAGLVAAAFASSGGVSVQRIGLRR